MAYRLLSEEVYRKEDVPQGVTGLDPRRFLSAKDRKVAIALSIIALPPTLLGILDDSAGFSLIAWFYLVGGVANLSSAYFKACTDLPPGKSIFAKAKEWFSRLFLRPLPIPQ